MTAISIDLAKNLRDIQESRDIRGFAIDSRYSGRYMYDETCLGITVDYLTDAFSLILKLENPTLERELTEFFSCCSRDSMGYGMILYARGFDWPEEVKLADDEEEEDEFDDEDDDEDESSESD